MIGGVGAGLFDGFDAIDRFLDIEAVHAPGRANREKYLQRMPIFDECHHALCGVYERL